MTDLERIKKIDEIFGFNLKKVDYNKIDYKEYFCDYKSFGIINHATYRFPYSWSRSYCCDDGINVIGLSLDNSPLNFISDTELDIPHFQYLKYLSLRINSISDLTFLEEQNTLISLDLSNNKIDNFSSLINLKNLKSLDLSNNNITDITCLKELTSIKKLNLKNNRISDFTSLRKLKEITSLNLSDNAITDSSFLKELKDIDSIDISNTQMLDISDLKDLKNLKTLSISIDQNLNVSELNSFKKLENLKLIVNNISDFSFLERLNGISSLELIVNEIQDVSILNKISNLSSISLNINENSNVSSLKDLKNPSSINLKIGQLKDYSFLEELNLNNIKSIDLSDNNLTDVSFLKNLKSLESLDLKFNYKINDVSILSELNNIRNLSLSINNITDISFLKNLSKITSLDLRGNKITNISSLKELSNLTLLDLSNNNINDVSCLEKINGLAFLDISNNQIEDISFLKEINSITYLDISNNNIADVSKLSCLKGICHIKLKNNKISNVSFLKNLIKFKYLDLSENKISDLSFLNEQNELITLELNNNYISDISNIRNLKKISFLDLRDNQINNIPEWMAQMGSIGFVIPNSRNYCIYLSGNDIQNPPLEIATKGSKSILNWYKARKHGSIINNEAKCILVGNSGAGKTTLSHQLRKNQFLKKYNSTHGIIIKDFVITKSDIQDKLGVKYLNSILELNSENTTKPFLEIPDSIHLNLWDFGGQEYYHATHRLFMSSNVLYILLWEEKTNKQNEEKGEYPVEYWENNIKHFSPQNIILNVQNKATGFRQKTDGEFLFNIDMRDEQKEESIIKYNIDIDTLKNGIFNQLKNLIHIGKQFPKVYIEIRKALREESRNYLTFENYKILCRETDQTEAKIMNDYSQIETLTNFLDDTGTIVCFRFREKINSDKLKDIVFIKPDWITNVIYSILEKDNVEFDKAHIEKVAAEYEIETDVWIDLMKEFELIFEIKKNDETLYVVPQYLEPECKNKEALDLVLEGNLIHSFTIKYPQFLPRSNFLRFIAKYGSQSKTYLYWKRGLVFYKEGKAVYAECNYEDKIISISIQDNDQIIAIELFETLIEIDDAENLQLSIDEKEFVEVRKLKEKIHNNNTEVESASGKTLLVDKFNFLFKFITQKMEIKIFVSYSSKDRELREVLIDNLEGHLKERGEMKYTLWTDKEIDIGANWKEEIEKALKASSVALLLVSANFVSSKFIKENELADFLKRTKEKGFLIMPVLIRSFNFEYFEEISTLQFFKTHYSDYGYNRPLERHKLLPFDVLCDDDKTSEKQLHDYYSKLADHIHEAVINKFVNK